MSERIARRKLLLLAAGWMAVTVPVAFSQQSPASSSRAETSAVDESYAVATIKLSDPNSKPSGSHVSSGSAHLSNMTLAGLIKFAYGLQEDELVGGPAWINSKRFDIEAKSEASVTVDPKKISDEQRKTRAANPMLPMQNLLADRFQLKVHRETRELPVYALVVAKGGSKLSPSDDQSSLERLGVQNAINGSGPGIRAFGRGKMYGVKVSIDEITHYFTIPFYFDQIGRRVVNMTGLTGIYDFKLEWTPDPGPGDNQPGFAPSLDSSGSSLFTAIQEQLGLKLEPQKRSVPVLVIDHAEMPSEN